MSNLTVNDLPSDGDESFGSERSGSRRGGNPIGGNSGGDGATFILVSGIPYAEREANVFNFLLDKFPKALSIHIPTDGDDEKIKGVAFIELSSGVNVYNIMNQFKGLEMGGQKLRINKVAKRDGRSCLYHLCLYHRNLVNIIC